MVIQIGLASSNSGDAKPAEVESRLHSEINVPIVKGSEQVEHG